MHWRYQEHPTRSYQMLQHKNSNEWMIIRFIKLFGLKSGVIMKTSCTDRKTFTHLLLELRRDFKNKINFFTTLQSRSLSNFLLDPFQGRFALPRVLSPRQFSLIVYPLNRSLINKNTRISFALGDYEAL